MIGEKEFVAFYDRTKRGLRNYIARCMSGDPHGDDIFQDSYVRFLQSGVKAESESKMKSYLYRIATNLMRDYWRRNKIERSHRAGEPQGFEAYISDASTDPVRADLRHDLARALDSLAPKQRLIVWLAYAEDYTHSEIGKILNVRENSVKVLLHRAKRKLLDIFQQTGIAQRGDA